jgi:uncharacterized protein (DUF3084 family)
MITDTLNGLLVSLKAALPLLFELSKDTSTYHRDALEDAEEELTDAEAELDSAKAELDLANKKKLEFETAKSELDAGRNKIIELEEAISFAVSLETSKSINDKLIATRTMVEEAEAIVSSYNSYDIEHAIHKLDAARSTVKRHKGRVARERRRYDSKEAQITAKNKLIDDVIKNFS